MFTAMNPLLITSDSQLRSFIPNQVLTVKGETSLFDKLLPFISISEQWFFRHFVSENLIDILPVNILELCSNIVAVDAYRIALPQLDIVLTPNGLATVGTQNLVAASKARVDRLTLGLLADRDRMLSQLVESLLSISEWPDSPQGRWFGSTLFPSFDICNLIGETERIWDVYCRTRTQIVDLEASLADEWFSPELMSALRSENLRSDLTSIRFSILRRIRTQIVNYLNSGTFNSRRLADIVNYIRNFPGDFPEWHNSDTADLFSPPIFHNKMNSSGYFF